MSNKFTKEYTLDNINEFYEELEASINPKFIKFRVWCDYYTEIQRQKECNEVSNAYNNLYTGREDAGHWACKLMDIK